MFFPIDGAYRGRIFVRSVKNLIKDTPIISSWTLLEIDASASDVPIDGSGEIS